MKIIKAKGCKRCGIIYFKKETIDNVPIICLQCGATYTQRPVPLGGKVGFKANIRSIGKQRSISFPSSFEKRCL